GGIKSGCGRWLERGGTGGGCTTDIAIAVRVKADPIARIGATTADECGKDQRRCDYLSWIELGHERVGTTAGESSADSVNESSAAHSLSGDIRVAGSIDS